MIRAHTPGTLGAELRAANRRARRWAAVRTGLLLVAVATVAGIYAAIGWMNYHS